MREGDPDIDALVADAGSRLGWALATLANVLDPREIVIYGRMAELGPLLLGHVRRAIGAMALPIASRGIEVRALGRRDRGDGARGGGCSRRRGGWGSRGERALDPG